MKSNSDLSIPERNEFHEWYLKKYREEYSYGYTEMFKMLRSSDVESKIWKLVEEFLDDNPRLNVKNKIQ